MSFPPVPSLPLTTCRAGKLTHDYFIYLFCPFTQQEDGDRVSKSWKIQEWFFRDFPMGFLHVGKWERGKGGREKPREYNPTAAPRCIEQTSRRSPT